jgi:hypothetical protein
MRKEYIIGGLILITIIIYMSRNKITAVSSSISDAVIDKIIQFIIKYNEGGYVSAERAAAIGDTGGETNFGISKKAYPNLDIKNLTIEKAAAIYREDYLKPVLRWAPLTSPNLLYQILDMAINAGPGTAKLLYKSGMTADQYKAARLAKYATFKLWSNPDIKKSWTNRTNRNFV